MSFFSLLGSDCAMIYKQSRKATQTKDQTLDFFKIAKDNAPLPRKAQTELAIQAQAGDASARKTLVVCNMRMAINVANNHRRNGIELEDLIASAAGATLDAIRVFDVTSGANFPTVARQWMVARCQEVVKSRGVVSGDDTTTRSLYRKVRAASTALQAQGVDVTPDNVAAHLDIDAQKVSSAWSVVFGAATSMSAPVKSEDGATFGDTLASKYLRQDIAMERTRKSEQIASLLSSFISTLSLRDRHIFEARNLAEYLGNEPMAQATLAQINGISKPRVCQIEKALNRKCAEFFKNNGIAG